MKKIIRYFSLLIGLTASFTSLAREKISLMLDWYVNPDHAAIIVAQQKGFFEKNNLDVEIIEPADPSLPPKLVAAGKVDLAINYQPQLYQQFCIQISSPPMSRIVTYLEVTITI